MADRDEIFEAYADWRERCNENERLRRMLRGWDRVVHLVASDTGDRFTVTIKRPDAVRAGRRGRGRWPT